MGSGLHCDQAPRYLSERLLHRFRCRQHFLFQNDFASFIQNTVERPAISQIHTNRQLLLIENFVLKCQYSANLLHSRSPFLVPRARLSSGAYRIPLETGLLIPSGTRSAGTQAHSCEQTAVRVLFSGTNPRWPAYPQSELTPGLSAIRSGNPEVMLLPGSFIGITSASLVTQTGS